MFFIEVIITMLSLKVNILSLSGKRYYMPQESYAFCWTIRLLKQGILYGFHIFMFYLISLWRSKGKE